MASSSFIPIQIKQKNQIINNELIPEDMHSIINSNRENLNNTFLKEVKKYYISETIKLSVATGPLYIIAGQMQYLNELPNIRNAYKYNSFNRYYELGRYMITQGFSGLYKGNLFRLSFFTSSVIVKERLDNTIGYKYMKTVPKVLKEVIFFSISDIILNPLLFIETRLMLQNKNGNFKQYKNVFHICFYSYKEFYKGSILSIYRNIFLVVGINLYFLYPSTIFNIFCVFLSHLLSYPFLTIQRNIIAKSQNMIYLDNDLVSKSDRGRFRINEIIQYLNVYGLKRLYSGFCFYISAVGLWHYYVPLAAKYKYYQNLL